MEAEKPPSRYTEISIVLMAVLGVYSMDCFFFDEPPRRLLGLTSALAAFLAPYRREIFGFHGQVRFFVRRMIILSLLLLGCYWLVKWDERQREWIRQRHAFFVNVFTPELLDDDPAPETPWPLSIYGIRGCDRLRLREPTPELISRAKELFPEATTFLDADGKPVH